MTPSFAFSSGSRQTLLLNFISVPALTLCSLGKNFSTRHFEIRGVFDNFCQLHVFPKIIFKIDIILSSYLRNIPLYFIVSGEISVYLMKIKVVSITSEMISYHFTIVSDTIYIFTLRFGRLRFSSLFQKWMLPPLQIFEHL